MIESEKRIKWYMLSFMAFSTLWGFGNVVNGFLYFNGVQVIFSWIMMFLLYFIPNAFMVGELGSAFKNEGGGVTSWIRSTTNEKLAYYAGWTYWACHITYIASKGSGGLKALSWMIFQSSEAYDAIPTIYIQVATLVVFLFFCWVASRGINPLKNLATLAGSSMFVMSILYILMMFAAPKINPGGGYLSADWTFDNLIPTFDMKYFTSLSILVFAVGGIEKMSPYVNKMEGDPSRAFPKAMIFAAIMVIISAIFGTIAMGMMFDPELINASPEAFDSYLANGAYMAFQQLGEYYGIGNTLMIIYALCNTIGQFSTLVVSIDAPLRMLLEDDRANKFIPRTLLKKNKYGAFINGIKLIVILCGAIIVAQIVAPGAAAVLRQLTKLNSIVMPLRYLWVFVAYIALRKKTNEFPREYKFVKGNGIALFFGGWCFFVTAACCLLGIISDDPFQMMLNIITPVVLIALGMILPVLRAREDKKLGIEK
ncbi:amino acid transporter [Peptoniphilus olsenii]|uniref:Amino acid transporter n=1 Tax=Peptoniphilus olsenii TaxID=411570 RepID=A0ABV2J8I8_9FIRM